MLYSAAPVRRFLLSIIAAAGVLIAATPATADRLSAGAIPSYRASQTLLLDIERSGDRLIAAGDHGVIIYSDDDGQQWQQSDTPFSVMITALDFPSAEQGWAVGHDGLIARTRDGGGRWQAVLDGNDINRLRLARLEQLYSAAEARVDAEPDNDALLDRLDSLSFQLEDAQIAMEEGPAIPLLDIWFADQRTGFALGGYGILLRTDDAGDSWQYWGDRLPNPDSFHLNSMTRDHHGALYIAGEAGHIFRSDDGGESWILLDSPYQGSFFAIASQGGRLYLSGLRGHLFTSDNGADWRAVDIPTDKTLNAIIPLDDDVLIVGQGGAVFKGYGDNFSAVKTGVRRSFSAAVATGQRWFLVGEGGVMTVSATQEATDNE